MRLVSFKLLFFQNFYTDCGILDGSDNEQHIADYELGWRSILAQKTVLVCFKADSDEIIGVNVNFVNSKEDNFIKKFYDLVSLSGTRLWALSINIRNNDKITFV